MSETFFKTETARADTFFLGVLIFFCPVAPSCYRLNDPSSGASFIVLKIWHFLGGVFYNPANFHIFTFMCIRYEVLLSRIFSTQQPIASLSHRPIVWDIVHRPPDLALHGGVL